MFYGRNAAVRSNYVQSRSDCARQQRRAPAIVIDLDIESTASKRRFDRLAAVKGGEAPLFVGSIPDGTVAVL